MQFLSVSCPKGLIVPEHLALAGDGAPVRTAVQQPKTAVLPVTVNAIILSRTAILRIYCLAFLTGPV